MQFGPKTPFKLGGVHANLESVFGPSLLALILKKFDDRPQDQLLIAARELARYLFLCAYAPNTVFFAGNTLVDQVWHACITETLEYRRLCNRIRPGHFVDHAGQKFSEYATNRSTEEIRDEQLSTLISYFENFGPLDESAFNTLSLAQNLAKRLNFESCESLNLFLQESLRIWRNQQDQSCLREILTREIRPNANLLDPDVALTQTAARRIMLALRQTRSSDSSNQFENLTLPTQEEFDDIFHASPVVAFTLWQHFAAVQRLSRAKEWQKSNRPTWEMVRTGELLVGLATTHLIQPDPIHAHIRENRIFGVAPWSSGFGLFSKFVLGCRRNDETVFILLDYPERDLSLNKSPILVEHFKLGGLNGTSSIRMTFDGLNFKDSDVVSSYSGPPSGASPSRFLLPEVGILRSIIDDICDSLSGNQVLRTPRFEAAVRSLENKFLEIKRERNFLLGHSERPIEAVEALGLRLYSALHGATRILTMLSGGSSLEKGSTALRRQLELILLDSTPSSPGIFEAKLTKWT